MAKSVSKMDPNELVDEAFTVLDIIVAEFESDPLSTQCFDRRIVVRAMDVIGERKLRRTHMDRFFKGG